MADEKREAYGAEEINVLDGLEGVRTRFDVIELSRKIKRKGDILTLSRELKIRPRILASAVKEGRILSLFPELEKSKAGVLASLRTNRELLLFSNRHDIYNNSARMLIKLVRQWNKELQINPKILITPKEHDLIIGSLLGDASIRQRERNSCFRVAHSIKQREYIKWKLNLLKNFNISEFNERKRIINKREVNMIYLATDTHSVFNYYRNLFYKNGKKIITPEILNQINPRSLAIWICDDGSYDNTQGYIVLCTNAYSLKEHELMQKFFEEKFGLSPTVDFRDGKYYYLRFKQQDSKELIRIIKDYIPECMLYKIGGLKNVC